MAKILKFPEWARGQRFSLHGREVTYHQEAGQFTESIGYSVDELGESFQQVRSFEEWLETRGPSKLSRETLDSLAGLWNLTPRDDLEGYRPMELYLRELLLAGPHIDARDEITNFGTRHVQCSLTEEMLRNEQLFTPAFFDFVEGDRREFPRF